MGTHGPRRARPPGSVDFRTEGYFTLVPSPKGHDGSVASRDVVFMEETALALQQTLRAGGAGARK